MRARAQSPDHKLPCEKWVDQSPKRFAFDEFVEAQGTGGLTRVTSLVAAASVQIQSAGHLTSSGLYSVPSRQM